MYVIIKILKNKSSGRKKKRRWGDVHANIASPTTDSNEINF